MNKKNKFLKKMLCIVLALCMVIPQFSVTGITARAADPKYYTVEKYDADGNGTMMVLPTKSTDWSGSYGDSFVKSLLGDSIRISDGVVTGIKDDSQEDGWLDNGDLGEGSGWIVAVWQYSQYKDPQYYSECFDDTSYFYSRNARVIRFMYVPGGDYDKAGITTEGASYGTVGKIKVGKDDLIQTLSEYDGTTLGGNRKKAYDAGIAMILNTKDATAEAVAQANENMKNASDSATGVALSAETLEIYEGQKATLDAMLEPGGSTDKLTWTSSDDTVVTVEDGVVKGRKAGTATITVTAENPEVTDSAEVTVKEIQSLYITNMAASDTIAAETEELNLMACTEPEGLENLDWQWSVVDDTVAEVTPAEGNEYLAAVRGKKEGTTKITVSLGTKTSEFEVHVTPYNGPYVYFDYADETKEDQLPDENGTITLTCLDEGSFVVGRPNGTTTWSGGSAFVPSLAGGDDLQYWSFINKETGKWSPWDVRDLNITVDSGGWSRTFTVKCVSSGITELKTYVGEKEVTVDEPYVTEGTIRGVPVAVKGKNAENEWVDIPTQALHYTTSDSTYNFRWTGNQMFISSGGQATMSVFMRDDWNVKQQFLAKCTYQPLTGFQITTPETFTITGEKDFMTGNDYGLQLYSDNLKIEYTPANATNKELTWEALTPDIAFYTTQHNSGIVPKRAGTAKFRVTSNDNPSLTQEVTVKFVYQTPLTQVSLEKTSYDMKVGDTEELNLVTTPSDATSSEFDWSYSEDGIVAVNGRTIVAKKAGTVTVTGTPYDTSGGCGSITFTVNVTEGTVEADDPMPVVKAGIAHGLSYLENQSVTKYGDEWNIFTILRAGGTISEADQETYLNNAEMALKEGLRQPTDYARVILTLGVMGEDPEDFRGINLIEKIYNWKDLDELTSNQISWTLLALDSRHYSVPEEAKWSRDSLIEMLLLFQDESGGFTLTDTTDVDMTGMIMQALAPYRTEQYPKVQAAFEKALTWLQEQMTTEAGFAANKAYNENSCTTAQVLTALSVAGLDAADGANGFTIGKKNMITNLWSYKAAEGFYWDLVTDTTGNAMGTQQTTYALEAYRRFAEKEKSLYDLTDVNPVIEEENNFAKAAENFAKKLETLPETEKLTLTDKAAVEALRKEYEALPEEVKALVSKEVTDRLSAAEAQIRKLEEEKKEQEEAAGNKDTPETDKTEIKDTPETDKTVTTPPTSGTTEVKLAKPVVSVKNKAGKRAVITWKKVSGANGYVVYRATKKNGKYRAIKTIGSGKTVKYTNSKLKKGATYYYKVRAYRKVDNRKVYSAYSKVRTVKIKK